MDPGTERRQLYGLAGSFRQKKYGVEYRSLSNWWIFSEETMQWFFENTHKAINFVQENRIINLKQFYNIQNFNLANQEIQYALTIHDKYNYGGEVLAMIKLIESKVMYHKMNFLKAIESTKIELFNYQVKNTI